MPSSVHDPDIGADTARLHDALKHLLRVYQYRDRDRICCHDVSVTQCHALEHLVEEGAIGQNELAAALYLDKSTTSRVVSALERKGYLVRSPDPADGRARLLEVTPDGRALVAAIEADILAAQARLLAAFDPEVRKSMARLIDALARAQASTVDASGGSCCTLD
jgi:MarR family transcriptional regulator, 2-MHQ and catechol-resistance regulon repressor